MDLVPPSGTGRYFFRKLKLAVIFLLELKLRFPANVEETYSISNISVWSMQAIKAIALDRLIAHSQERLSTKFKWRHFVLRKVLFANAVYHRH